MISKERLEEIKKITSKLQDKSIEQIARENNILLTSVNLDNIIEGGLSGIIRKTTEGKYEIFVNENDVSTRRRFTYAHELGHFFLHLDKLKEEGLIYDEKGNSYLFRDNLFEKVPEDRRIMEEEANEFAGNLLMPENIFLENYKKYSVPELSEIFGVSQAAINVRAYNLTKRNGK